MYQQLNMNPHTVKSEAQRPAHTQIYASLAVAKEAAVELRRTGWRTRVTTRTIKVSGAHYELHFVQLFRRTSK